MLAFLGRLLGLRQRGVRIEASVARRLRRSALVLGGLLVAHVVAMMVFERGQFEHGVLDAVWLTLTTVLTIGYGDVSAATIPGKLATMLLLYTAAVFIAANIASLAVELRMDRLNRMRIGTWRWNLRDHILIVNAPESGAERYFIRLLTELRADRDYRDIPVLILTDRFSEGLPESVHDLGAVYYNGSPHDAEALIAAGVAKARYVVLLASDENHPRSDSLNFDVLLEMHELYTSAKIIAEVVDSAGRERFRRFGAHRLIRPVRAYPEFVVRAITCPGSEVVLEDLLAAAGSVTRRYNVRINGPTWADVATALLRAGYGTPLAYVNESRRVVSNPAAEERVRGRGLIVLTQPSREPTRSDIQDVIESLTPAAG